MTALSKRFIQWKRIINERRRSLFDFVGTIRTGVLVAVDVVLVILFLECVNLRFGQYWMGRVYNAITTFTGSYGPIIVPSEENQFFLFGFYLDHCVIARSTQNMVARRAACVAHGVRLTMDTFVIMCTTCIILGHRVQKWDPGYYRYYQRRKLISFAFVAQRMVLILMWALIIANFGITVWILSYEYNSMFILIKGVFTSLILGIVAVLCLSELFPEPVPTDIPVYVNIPQIPGPYFSAPMGALAGG